MTGDGAPRNGRLGEGNSSGGREGLRNRFQQEQSARGHMTGVGGLSRNYKGRLLVTVESG